MTLAADGTTILRNIGAALLWVFLAIVVGVGAAGIVTGLGGAASADLRPELTFGGDQALRSELRASGQLITDLSTDAQALGERARFALTRISGRDTAGTQAAIDDGTAIAARIAANAAALTAAAASMPGGDPYAALHYGSGLRAQRALLASAADAANGVKPTWARFTTAALAADRMAGLLTQHDQQTGEAARLGAGGKYREALAILDQSDATLADIERFHEDLKPVTDTSVLATWIDRSKDYDKAIRTLYQETIRAGGRNSDALEAAIRAEVVARAALPGDTRALTVVMTEISQGGLNQAAGAIVDVENRLEEILAQLDVGR